MAKIEIEQETKSETDVERGWSGNPDELEDKGDGVEGIWCDKRGGVGRADLSRKAHAAAEDYSLRRRLT